MRAMRVERADSALLVAEQDDLLAEQLFLARQIFQLLGEADRLPITTQEFAHRAARLDAGQLVIGWRGLPSISRFHHLLPSESRNTINADANAERTPLSTPECTAWTAGVPPAYRPEAGGPKTLNADRASATR